MTPLTGGNAALWSQPEIALNHQAGTCSLWRGPLDLKLNAYSRVCQISHQYPLNSI